METFAAIIPSRGDRPMFDIHQVERARVMGYDSIHLVDYPPLDNSMDLYQRIAVGVAKVLVEGHTWCSIIENDDWYSPKYLYHIKDLINQGKHSDMIGFADTTYYFLKNNGYLRMNHPGRSSLFCTTFRTELFGRLPVNPPGYLDMAWWRFMLYSKFNWKLSDNNEKYALGIKHGIGKSGGNGHRESMYNTFDRIGLLKKIVGEEDFNFYQTIKSQL